MIINNNRRKKKKNCQNITTSHLGFNLGVNLHQNKYLIGFWNYYTFLLGLFGENSITRGFACKFPIFNPQIVWNRRVLPHCNFLGKYRFLHFLVSGRRRKKKVPPPIWNKKKIILIPPPAKVFSDYVSLIAYLMTLKSVMEVVVPPQTRQFIISLL